MAYDSPNRVMYTSVDGSITTGNLRIKGPLGKIGRVYDYGVFNVSTAVAGAASFSVGTLTDVDAYMNEVDCDATSTVGAASMRTELTTPAARDAIFIADLPADTTVALHWVGASAGVATVFVTVDWQD